MRNGNYPGDGESQPIKIRVSVHINYRPLLFYLVFYLGFDLTLLTVLLGVPRLIRVPSGLS
jgi:hypothetical protein